MRFADVPAPPVDAYQNVGEFGALWEHVAARPHARVLEIGSLYGGTLWWWSHLHRIERLVSVDLPSDWPQVRDGVREAREHWFEWCEDRVQLHDFQTDSQDAATIEAVGALGPFDVAFIDGDHTYEGVRADWLAYSPMVSPGGLVAFHDTVPNGDRREPGVVRLADELRCQLPSIEWTDPDGVGIRAFTLPGGEH